MLGKSDKTLKQQKLFQNNLEWYKEFIINTDNKQMIINRVKESLQNKSPAVWQKLINHSYQSTILFVGAGSGSVEIPIIKIITNTRKSSLGITVHCIDASEALRKEFLKTAGKDKQVIDTISEKNYALGQFQDNYQPPVSDLAIASHVWYYIDNWKKTDSSKNTLLKFARAVKHEGVGLIVILSRQHDYYPIKKAQTPRIYPDSSETYGEELVLELKRLGINYQTEIVEAHLNVSSCFKNGKFKPNRKGKNLLSFILRASWDEQPKTEQEKIGAILTEKVQKYPHEVGKEGIICRDLFIWIKGEKKNF